MYGDTGLKSVILSKDSRGNICDAALLPCSSFLPNTFLWALKPKSLALSGINQISISMVTAPLQCTQGIFIYLWRIGKQSSPDARTHTHLHGCMSVHTQPDTSTHITHWYVFSKILMKVKGKCTQPWVDVEYNSSCVQCWLFKTNPWLN